MADRLARKERHIAARKEQILNAAAQLFAERGFHRTTTHDIAELAEVSEGTLYNYFDSKDDILMGIMSHLAEQQNFEIQLDESLSDDPKTFLKSSMHLRKLYVDQNAVMLQAILSEILANAPLRQQYLKTLFEPSLALLERHLRKRSELGQIRPVNESFISRILTGMALGVFVLQTLGDPLLKKDWDALNESLADLIFKGIAPPDTPEAVNHDT